MKELTEEFLIKLSKTDLTFEELKAELGITIKDKFLSMYIIYEILLVWLN